MLSFHHCDKIPKKVNVKEEVFGLTVSEISVPVHLACAVSGSMVRQKMVERKLGSAKLLISCQSEGRKRRKDNAIAFQTHFLLSTKFLHPGRLHSLSPPNGTTN